MTSLSSDVTNAVWHAYKHHEKLKGCVPRSDLIVSTPSSSLLEWEEPEIPIGIDTGKKCPLNIF